MKIEDIVAFSAHLLSLELTKAPKYAR